MNALTQKLHRSAKSYLGTLAVGMRETIFPRVCATCQGHCHEHERYVCVACRATLPTLDLHTLPENQMTDRFWGRLPVERAASLLPYVEDGSAQRIMRALKYDDRPELGYALGAWLGQLLAGEDSAFGRVEAVVPVPLHPRRQRMRGYNQAERIAAGLAEVLEARCLPHAVERVRNTTSQTKQSRFGRVANVEGIFRLRQAGALRGRIVLLVDDVLTTGATLEALGREVAKASPAALKVATLAVAGRI